MILTACGARWQSTKRAPSREMFVFARTFILVGSLFAMFVYRTDFVSAPCHQGVYMGLACLLQMDPFLMDRGR